MGDAELLLAELEELKALLGDDYLSVDARPQQKVRSLRFREIHQSHVEIVHVLRS